MPRNREDTASSSGERIAKAMARAGLCSRREAEAWIVAGRVAVNGAVIASPALDVAADDKITVDGVPLPGRERTRLFLYHKPRGLLTTHADPQGRQTIFAALPKHLPRLLSVGRLDLNTEGLLLLTNEGGLARVLELPTTGWLRRYRVRAHGSVQEDALARLRAGITIDGVRYGSIEASLDRPQGSNVWLTFAMREGKNREVKNVLGHLGLKVNRLIRVSFGPFQLGELAAGDVAEVPTRVLREQVGEKVAQAAGTDFTGPIMDRAIGAQPPRRHPEETAEATTRDDGRKAPHKARAPRDEGQKVRANKLRRRDAERLGEPALARRERRGPKPRGGKSRGGKSHRKKR